MLIASLIRYDECMRRALFGEHGGQLPTLRREIEPSVTPLFLFNFSRRVLYGPFYATDAPQMNLEPTAWNGATSRRTNETSGGNNSNMRLTSGFPAQVRVCRLGTVRQWKLPDLMHLKAGKLNAVETSTFLRELGSPGGKGSLIATDDC